MPLDDLVGCVVANPGRALIVFPDQRLQEKILLHQRCSSLGISEDEHLLRPQGEPFTRASPL
jgi:hypothetical protein